MLSMSFLPRFWPFSPKTLGDCLCLSLSFAIIMIIILSRVLIQLARTRYLPVKAASEHCCLLKGLCNNSPPPYPTSFAHKTWSPPVKAVSGLSSCTDQDSKPPNFLDTAPAWIGRSPAPGENLVAMFWRNQTDIISYIHMLFMLRFLLLFPAKISLFFFF